MQLILSQAVKYNYKLYEAFLAHFSLVCTLTSCPVCSVLSLSLISLHICSSHMKTLSHVSSTLLLQMLVLKLNLLSVFLIND